MKRKTVIGILLIILGIIICAGWIGSFTKNLYEKWVEIADYGYWDTFSDYFWQVGKTNLVLSALFGSIPVIAGIINLRKK